MPSADRLLWTTADPGRTVALRGSRCDRCGRIEFPSRTLCPTCGSVAAAIPLGPRARLRTVTSVLHPPPGSRVPVPYVVGVAEFPEGISILGLVVIDAQEHVTVGDPVDTIAYAPADVSTYGFLPRPEGEVPAEPSDLT